MDERFKALFAAIKVYNKKEKIGLVGGLKTGASADARPGRAEADLRRGGGGLQDQRGHGRGGAMPALLPDRDDRPGVSRAEARKDTKRT